MKVYECILTSGAFMITGRDASPLLRNLFEILQISLSFLNLNPQNVVSFFFFLFFFVLSLNSYISIIIPYTMSVWKATELITFFDVRSIVHNLDDQSGSLQRDPVVSPWLCAREMTRVVTAHILEISPQQCICSQRREHPAVPGREEHRRTGTISLFTWSWSVLYSFSFLQVKRNHQWEHFEGVEAVKWAVTTELRAIQEKSFHSAWKRGSEEWNSALDAR